MKKALLIAAGLALAAAAPAFAQYGGGGQNSGGPRGSYLRSQGLGGYGYGGGYGGGYYYAPRRHYAPRAYYGGGYGYGRPYYVRRDGYYGRPHVNGGAVAAGVIGGLALGAIAAQPYGYYGPPAYAW
jgi:hypothetical protein